MVQLIMPINLDLLLSPTPRSLMVQLNLASWPFLHNKKSLLVTVQQLLLIFHWPRPVLILFVYIETVCEWKKRLVQAALINTVFLTAVPVVLAKSSLDPHPIAVMLFWLTSLVNLLL